MGVTNPGLHRNALSYAPIKDYLEENEEDGDKDEEEEKDEEDPKEEESVTDSV